MITSAALSNLRLLLFLWRSVVLFLCLLVVYSSRLLVLFLLC